MHVQLSDSSKGNDSFLDVRIGSISKLNITSADNAKVGMLSEQNLEITKMEGHSNLKKPESSRTGYFLLPRTLKS